MFNRLKLKYHTWKYNKLVDAIRKNESLQKQAALDYLMEEIDRKLDRSEGIIDLFHNIKQGKKQ